MDMENVPRAVWGAAETRADVLRPLVALPVVPADRVRDAARSHPDHQSGRHPATPGDGPVPHPHRPRDGNLTRHRVHGQKSRHTARHNVLTDPHPHHVSTFCSFRCPDLQLRAVEANKAGKNPPP